VRLVPHVDAGEYRRVRSHGCQGGSHGTAARTSWRIEGRTSLVMRNSTSWARITALAASLAIITAGLPASSVFAQQAPSVDLEQARSGEDGTTGAGANSGNTSTGNAKRDNNGNGQNASAGSAGEGGTTEPVPSEEASLPENAETLEALGVLDLVTEYNLTILTGLEVPLTLLPPPPAGAAPEAPSDIDSGGQAPSGVTSGEATIDETTTDETSTIATESGSDGEPAGGSTGTAAADGIGATDSGEKPRDRPRKNDDGSVYEAPGG
jgi:hypothetical protein